MNTAFHYINCCPVNFSELSTTLALLVWPYIYAMRHTVSGNEFHSISLTVFECFFCFPPGGEGARGREAASLALLTN